MAAKLQDLKERIALLPDDELSARYASRQFTDAASGLALAEIQSRGIPEPAFSIIAENVGDEPYYGDLQRVARDLTPTEAHLLCGYLNAAGIPAEACDTHIVQMNSLLSVAVGGASVRVPESFMTEALEVMDAFRRGEFQLDEDFDGGAA